MPRAGSPYGPAHQKRREKVLKGGAACHKCGKPATELDHVPPLALHRHREGSGCCHTLPACSACQRAQGGLWAQSFKVPGVEIDAEAGIIGRGPEDPVWAVAWLERFRQVPDDAVWPRFMTAPHPQAVGSYGAGAIAWLAERRIVLRWWQELALTRQLEHDCDGQLVWLDVLLTCARQSGKSTLLRSGAWWRLHQSSLFGEAQLIMHTAKDLQIAKEVRRDAKVWAVDRGYDTRETNGAEEIIAPDGARWLVRGKASVYGYAVSYAIGDECWGIDPAIIDDGLLPTMLERKSPQITLASTAHRKATPLMPVRRAQALTELDVPRSTLLVEWSAPRTMTIDDLAGVAAR